MRKLKFTMQKAAALIAIVLAVGTSAFTTEKAPKKFSELYFVLKSQTDELSYAARTNPANWELANEDGSNIPCPTGAVHVCKILAEDNSGEPIIGGTGDPLFDKLYNGGSNSVPTQDGTMYFTKTDDN